MICLIARDATYGNAAALSEGLKELTPTVTVFFEPDPKGMHRQTEWVDKIPRADHYIVVGAISLRDCPFWVRRNLTVIWTDTTYMVQHKKYNELTRGANVWVMPDLAHLCDSKQMYYHPFIMPLHTKNKMYDICHSPYHKTKLGPKGTEFIRGVCRDMGLDLTVIMDKTWEEAIRIKAQHRVCVDRISKPFGGEISDGVYTGGTGKSGLECMFLDTAVISGVKPDREGLPPVVWADKDNLEEKILYTLKNLDAVVDAQREWGRQNLTPRIVAQKILDSI